MKTMNHSNISNIVLWYCNSYITVILNVSMNKSLFGQIIVRVFWHMVLEFYKNYRRTFIYTYIHTVSQLHNESM